MRFVAGLIFCIAMQGAAYAQQADQVTAATVTSSSTTMLAAAQRQYLTIDNESASASIACNFGGTAALNTAGSFTIPPSQQRTWQDFGQTPNTLRNTLSLAINCISSVASSPATFEAH